MTTNEQLVDDILKDTSLSQPTLQKFVDTAKEIVKNANVSNNYETWNLEAVLNAAEITKHTWTKENIMSVALWVLFFAITGEHYPTAQLKYQDVNSFLKAYEGYFNDIDPAEQEMLKDEANWFKVVSTLLPPSKNKGLTIQIVPRLVEGWYAKYVTGSGQTEATKRRVHIFEKEGGVVPCGRGRSPQKKKKTIKAAKKTKNSSSKTSTVKSPSSKAGAAGRGTKSKTVVTTEQPTGTGRYHTRGKGYHRGASAGNS